MSEITKAKALYDEAEKKSSKTAGGFFSMFKSSSGVEGKEEAIDLYVKAGNLFKVGQKFTEAGNCYDKAARLNLSLGSKFDASRNLVEAGNCYKKEQFNNSVRCYEEAVNIYIDLGNLSMAARFTQNIAEIYEQCIKDSVAAMKYYERAANLYKGEESKSQANKCLLKIAEFSAIQEDYKKAISIYEEVAATSLNVSLLKYSVKDYFFKACICNLCLDVLAAERAIVKYSETLPTFVDTREYKLITDLIEAVTQSDAEIFTERLKQFDSVSRLDNWYTTLFLRIKKPLEGEDDIT